MELTIINQLFLELSQFATAKTSRELTLEAKITQLEAKLQEKLLIISSTPEPEQSIKGLPTPNPMRPFSDWLKEIGISDVWRERGWVKVISIGGRLYIETSEITSFIQRARAGEFAEIPEPLSST